MKMILHRLLLPLEYEFTIARGSRSEQPSLIVELSHNGVSGFGEATGNPYYGHSLDSMAESLERVRPLLSNYQFGSPEELWSRARTKLGEDSFALSAMDIAAHDLYGKLQGRPTYQVWGLTWDRIPDSSYTIGIAEVETMVEKLNQYAGWSIYKIKLGTANDVEIVRELRRHTRAVFRVDANCGWTAEETVRKSRELAELNVEFIEQPLPADASREDKLRVFEQSALPIIADESCLIESDVQRCHGVFHGFNVKLSKCGGLTPALRMLRQGRSLGMKTMVGCMVESSVGISAAAQLLPLLDYADLDGAVLLKEDPAAGVRVEQGKIYLADRPGSGAELVAELASKLAC